MLRVDRNIKECSGCSACQNICPLGAISMREDDEGFLSPVIDGSKCNKCGLCHKICNSLSNRNSVIESYAAYSDDEKRSISSSGGIFSAFAQWFLSNNGYVVGAEYSDNYKRVEHIIVSSINDLKKLCSSKYLQSDLKTVYKDIKNLLEQEKLVLFTGTPCQVDGLNKFLQKKYENLITIDILCHGVPSPLVWKKYVEEVSQGRKILNVNFRDKKEGWSPKLLLSFLFEDGSSFEEFSSENLYYRAFLSNLCLRKSCETCSYANIERVSDITIGDFWGINKFDKKLNDGKGISCVLVNTLKGKHLFDLIVPSLNKYKKAPMDIIVKGNPILKQPSQAHLNRDKFFSSLATTNILDNMKINLQVRYDGVIANFWHSLGNYGAVLTAYAIQQYFKERGKDFYLINYISDKKAQKITNSFGQKFANKYLLLTERMDTLEDLKKLNYQTDNFVVGSDQVFRYIYTQNLLDLYLLKFTEFSKKRVAFSASFGVNNYEANEEETYNTRIALARFDSISVREKGAVKLCKNTFDIDVQHIFDPVFLVNKEKFEALVLKDLSKYNGKIVCYILDLTSSVRKNIIKLSKKLNIDVEFIEGENVSVEEWLTAIKTCRYFITDSFHGCCFSLLFHSTFICLKNRHRGTERFDTLQVSFKIKNNFIDSSDKFFDLSIFENKIDWDYVDSVILKEKKNAEIFYDNAFNRSKEINHKNIASELDFLKQNFTGQIEKLNKKPIENIFSVKNSENGKHKIVTALGMKIKIKRRK